jgi:putative ABC transport system permease protein
MAAIVQLVNDIDATSLTDEQKEMIRGLLHSADEDEKPEPASANGQKDAPEDITPPEDIAPAEDNTPHEDITLTERFVVRAVVRDQEYGGIAGLFRNHSVGSYGKLFLDHEVAMRMQTADPQQQTFHAALVSIDSTRNLAEVSAAIEEIGCHPESALRILESIESQIDRSAWIVYGIAIAILFTSAIGISNTLIISVLERTPEFGILKSIGARDSHILALMISEGVFLGVVGAAISIAISGCLSWCGQFALRAYVEGQLGGEMPGNLFNFSWVMAGAVIIVSIVICSLASVRP